MDKVYEQSRKEFYVLWLHRMLKYSALRSASKRKARENTFIRQKMQDYFRTSALKEELMQTVFHPKNIHKFKDWGFDE